MENETATRWLTEAEQCAWRTHLEVNRLLTYQLEKDLQPFGLTMNDYEILVNLSESEGVRMRISHLASATLQSKSRPIPPDHPHGERQPGAPGELRVRPPRSVRGPHRPRPGDHAEGRAPPCGLRTTTLHRSSLPRGHDGTLQGPEARRRNLRGHRGSPWRPLGDEQAGGAGTGLRLPASAPTVGRSTRTTRRPGQQGAGVSGEWHEFARVPREGARPLRALPGRALPRRAPPPPRRARHRAAVASTAAPVTAKHTSTGSCPASAPRPPCRPCSPR